MLHLEPATYREAITSKEFGMWSTTMGEDIESLHKNNTWELVKPPERRKLVGLAHHNLQLEQLDVKTAFLHGDLEEEIYMSQPEGFVAPSGSLIYLLLYVDDMLVAAKDIAKKSYIEKIISRFGMSLAKSVNTPSSANFCLSTTCAPQTEAEIEYMSRIPYVSTVVSFMYVMVCTRPDIAHVMSVVSRYMAHPGKEHWNAVKHVFCYLKGTSDVGLIYGGDHEYLVVGYLDLDYDADLDARRSLTGYVFTIGNSVVSWKATLQPSVALSTTEAEYMALTEATKVEIWLKGLIEDFGFPQDQATVFYDSMSVICLAKDQVYHDQTKHIDVLYHFIGIERRITMKKIGIQNNPADVFTKPVKCKYVTRNMGKGRKNEENTDSYETLRHHGFVGYPFDYCVTLGFGSIAGGLDHVNPVIRLRLEHGISRVLGLDDYSNPSTDDQDAFEHVRVVFEIIDLFHFPSVTHDAVMLRVFPITLKGRAMRWKKRLPAGVIITWDLLEKEFIWQYCSPCKTAKKLEEILNFKQERDETLYHDWERYNDLLYRYLQHDLNY
ncbi:retrovirus-related pol polyprotein from transposon TNT 1-94 [Tanacetum coccineum]|uniref:Retrovirus-related pol polyprotein from transposon TNT 1-94 n=1 Tax=Tanacetum coccineum TaxID=301880 RepID=A0ABQ5DKB5_9ASTR